MSMFGVALSIWPMKPGADVSGGGGVPATALLWGASNELVWGSGNYLTWG